MIHICTTQVPFKNHSKSNHRSNQEKRTEEEIRFWGLGSDRGPDPDIEECTGSWSPRSESSSSSVLGSPPRSGLLDHEVVAALLADEEPVPRRSQHNFHGQSSPPRHIWITGARGGLPPGGGPSARGGDGVVGCGRGSPAARARPLLQPQQMGAGPSSSRAPRTRARRRHGRGRRLRPQRAVRWASSRRPATVMVTGQYVERSRLPPRAQPLRARGGESVENGRILGRPAAGGAEVGRRCGRSRRGTGREMSGGGGGWGSGVFLR
jgi:hypothetical protein